MKFSEGPAVTPLLCSSPAFAAFHRATGTMDLQRKPASHPLAAATASTSALAAALESISPLKWRVTTS